MAQLQNELAEKELIKKFRHDNSWLGELTSKQQWVGNGVIKIPRQGSAPNVLINNNIFPIASDNREDDFIALSLNKYDTENTDVTEDELYALPYEKISDVQQQHRETLEDKTAEHALYSIAPAAASLKAPVLETTGPLVGGRRRLTTEDLINFGLALTKANVPLAGRVLVLTPEHSADLMVEDSGRQRSWGADFSTGAAPVTHAGFRLWTATYSPRYAKVGGVWTRQGFESVAGTAATIAFFKKNAIKATGDVKRFAIPAELNPTYRKHQIGFQLYFIAVIIKEEGSGAIVDGTA